MNITGKFLKVWKVTEEPIRKVDLGDSSKQKDGSYVNWTWFGVAFFGEAAKKEINEGDVIEVKSGLIGKRKHEGKYYDDLKVFDFEVTQKGEKKDTQADIVGVDDLIDLDLPF